MLLLLAGQSVTAKCVCHAARQPDWRVNISECCTVFEAEAARCAVGGHFISTDITGDCWYTQVQRNICWRHGANCCWSVYTSEQLLLAYLFHAFIFRCSAATRSENWYLRDPELSI